MTTILLILFGVFLVLLVFGMPISFALALASVAALLNLGTYDLTVIVQRMFTSINSFSLMAIPFFMLAGELMEVGGISRRIVNFANAFVGWITGGLAMACVLGSMIFAGVSGSAVATAAAMGSILVPAMEEKKYGKGYSASVVATAGTIGPIIPPSIPMVIYGSITGASIGRLFVGGYIPGILIGLGLMIVAYLIAKKRNYPKTNERISLREIGTCTADALLSLFMPFIIIGGILLGIFTPTEAGAVACVYAFILGAFFYKEIKLKDLYRVMEHGVQITTIVMFLVAVASLFGWILTAEGLPAFIVKSFLNISTNPLVILLLLNVMLLIVGMFMDCTPAIILLMPVLTPLLKSVGIDFVHFGVVMILNLGIGLVTPPVGTCLFVAGKIANISIVEIVKEIFPFLLVMTALLFFITYVPWTVTWLPSVLIG